ncbi:MAG TPA: heavy-metal-associated domain-containing protein [Chitinophagaceae bacterium]|nr:heavy-metal-associated domain-containing protein [Chitinophagaceae bacterium]
MKNGFWVAWILSLCLVTNLQATEKEKPVTETIHVKGNCGTCKKTIEGALHIKAVKKARWDEESKILTVSYYASQITNDSIQHRVANAGYDTEKFKASESAYNNLHACCKYDR